MRLSRSVAVMLFAIACWRSVALAQSFPDKPFLVVTTTAGAGADLVARLVAQGLTANFGQPAVVLNRAGSQVIPAMQVAKAPPDGYTIMALGGNLFWLYPFLQDDVPYDPLKDFLPVTLTARSPNLVVVHPSVPVNNVKELIALARAKPGALNFGTGGAGGSPHLAGELFKAMSQTNIVTVRYKGTAPAVNAILAGEIQLLFPTASTGMPVVKTGRVRALAVTSDQPTLLAPGLPTLSETLPGYQSSSAYAVFVPAKTPAPVINRLHRAIAQYLQAPEIKKKMFDIGIDIVGSSPQELAAAMKADMEKMGKVIRDAGIRGE